MMSRLPRTHPETPRVSGRFGGGFGRQVCEHGGLNNTSPRRRQAGPWRCGRKHKIAILPRCGNISLRCVFMRNSFRSVANTAFIPRHALQGPQRESPAPAGAYQPRSDGIRKWLCRRAHGGVSCPHLKTSGRPDRCGRRITVSMRIPASRSSPEVGPSGRPEVPCRDVRGRGCPSATRARLFREGSGNGLYGR
jgi:hypothetical protein